MQAKAGKKERIKKFGEVFTPPHIVKDMVDLVEPDISNPEKTVLEPSCGTGNFLVEILERRLARCRNHKERLQAISNMYGVELLPDNLRICHDRLVAMMPENMRNKARKVFERNIVQGDFLKPETIWFLQDNTTKQGGLFDV